MSTALSQDKIIEIINETVTKTMEEVMVFEGFQPKVKFTINGVDVEFGSKEHLLDLKRTLIGLEKLKNCYSKGSANRHVYSSACTKIKRLLKQLTLK